MSGKCNNAFRLEHGTDQFGEKNPHAKLTESKVKLIKILIRDGFRNMDIASFFDLRVSHVSSIKNKYTRMSLN